MAWLPLGESGFSSRQEGKSNQAVWRVCIALRVPIGGLVNSSEPHHTEPNGERLSDGTTQAQCGPPVAQFDPLVAHDRDSQFDTDFDALNGL